MLLATSPFDLIGEQLYWLVPALSLGAVGGIVLSLGLWTKLKGVRLKWWYALWGVVALFMTQALGIAMTFDLYRVILWTDHVWEYWVVNLVRILVIIMVILGLMGCVVWERWSGIRFKKPAQATEFRVWWCSCFVVYGVVMLLLSEALFWSGDVHQPVVISAAFREDGSEIRFSKFDHYHEADSFQMYEKSKGMWLLQRVVELEVDLPHHAESKYFWSDDRLLLLVLQPTGDLHLITHKGDVLVSYNCLMYTSGEPIELLKGIQGYSRLSPGEDSWNEISIHSRNVETDIVRIDHFGAYDRSDMRGPWGGLADHFLMRFYIERHGFKKSGLDHAPLFGPWMKTKIHLHPITDEDGSGGQ